MASIDVGALWKRRVDAVQEIKKLKYLKPRPARYAMFLDGIGLGLGRLDDCRSRRGFKF
jgi:hypothetical protein